MTNKFRQNIHKALADPQLQEALDGNAERRQLAFTAAFESLPESRQALRQRAHAMRERVIENLDHHLDQFTARVAANGTTVHFAQDGAQAVEIVLEIAQRSSARLVVKSKTMVGEEVRLNQRLERAGLRVVETDLGEYIVQLRGEPPSHIITPAVHLKREQVARTFEEKLDLPYTTDIPALTRAARRVLRQTFLEADIGISGVNFGVAETGALVLVTNEGNGRMCTTLPPVHIALMGVERLVPTLDDLVLALNLLPRSATGQKLSVYTSLIQGLPEPSEGEGPSERHLILLDNGRRRLGASPLSEALLCIRCGACLNACPVFREIGGHAYTGLNGEQTPYSGPIGSVLSPGLFGVERFGHLARMSSLCGACKDACPIDIDLPRLLLQVRSDGAAPSTPSQPRVSSQVPAGMRLGLKTFSFFARSPARFRLAQRLGGVFSRLAPARDGWMRLPAFTGWGYGRDFPRLAAQPFSASALARALSPEAAERPLRKKAPAGQPVSASPLVRAGPASTPANPDLASRFAQELTDLGGSIVRCSTAGLPGRILDVLAAAQVREIQAWEEPHLPPGLIGSLQAAGIKVSHSYDPNIRAGLTGALAGIAESGSLALTAGAGRPSTASLLPEIHLAVLPRGRLYASLSEALHLPEARTAPSLVIISGPSRTADIEMTLTIGVHGPGELIVFLTDSN